MASDAARPAAGEASIGDRAPEVRRTSTTAQPSSRSAERHVPQAAGCTARPASTVVLLRSLLRFLLRHSVPVAKPCSETTREAHGAAFASELLVCYRTLARLLFLSGSSDCSMGSLYNEGYDDVQRYDVQCDFVDKITGCRCGEWGLWGNQANRNKPTAPTPRRHGIFCKGHAQQDERFMGGRNERLAYLQFNYPKDARKRAREQQRQGPSRNKQKADHTPNQTRRKIVGDWLGTRAFKELDPQRCQAVYAQLRIPPPLLGDDRDRTRIYLLDSFPLADLEYLYKARPSDGRRLYLVRGSSIIR